LEYRKKYILKLKADSLEKKLAQCKQKQLNHVTRIVNNSLNIDLSEDEDLYDH